jgi:hypothetical protein
MFERKQVRAQAENCHRATQRVLTRPTSNSVMGFEPPQGGPTRDRISRAVELRLPPRIVKPPKCNTSLRELQAPDSNL